jgi:hypothetical protein
MRTGVMIVEEFRQLFAQAFVFFALMPEHHGALEHGVLEILRQAAPEIGSGGAKHKQITGRNVVDDQVRLIHDASRSLFAPSPAGRNGKQTRRERPGDRIVAEMPR